MMKERSREAAPADCSQLDPLVSWHTDHRNFARVLDLIEQQIDAFHAGRHSDYELMHSIVYYLRHYPDCFHHPREDIAFARLVKRDPTLQLTIARRMQEHAAIAAAGEDLLKWLERINAGVVTERSSFEAAAATFVVYYRHHMAAEEAEVIPRAVELLTAADWAAVAAIPSASDPLFGPDFDARYQELRRQIARTARDER